MENSGFSRDFWQAKRVLVTGHTGFKGSWLCMWLLALGARVTGYALAPGTARDNYALCGLEQRLTSVEGNILDFQKLSDTFAACRPEIVFHLAAQPLVRRSYQAPRLTYETNVTGTLNVLEAARGAGSVRCAVMVTTDKCYENHGLRRAFRETDPMGGYDLYSSSKGCAELLIASYRRSFCRHGGGGDCGMALASARAGNVIGGGDWAEGRLVPDCIRAFEAGKPVRLRNPGAVRPWQFVLEPLAGYLMLAEALWRDPARHSEGWNFGPDAGQAAPVGEVAGELAALYGSGLVERAPERKAPHEDAFLLLDSTKARERLGWHPRLTLRDALAWTAAWYRGYRRGDPFAICRGQLEAYMGEPAAAAAPEGGLGGLVYG